MPLVYLGTFLLAGSVLLLEVSLTRVYAIMLWHHLAYMVVSVAMLGFGGAGVLLTVLREHRGELPGSTLGLLTSGFGVTALLVIPLSTHFQVEALELARDPGQLWLLGALYAITCLPFLFAGGAIGLLLTRLSADVDRIYGADLIGSACGGALSAVVLADSGSAGAVQIAGALGFFASACFLLAERGASGAARAAAPGVLGLVTVLATLGLGLPKLVPEVPFAPGKEFSRADEGAEIDRIFSATAEVEISPEQALIPIVGGDFGTNDIQLVQGRIVGQDGTAPTMLYRSAASLDAFPFLDDTQAAAAYVAHRARGGRAPKVLVIGVGGGVDVMIALAEGARRVKAVELNDAMIEMVTRRYDDYLGGLFRPGAHPWSDRIELVRAEGRSYARSSEDRYDVIQLSGVDSFTALSTGAYTLSESYLYTTEAVRDFFARLEPDGYINFSRFIMQRPNRPRETLRLAHIAFEALREAGVSDPASHLVVFQGKQWASTVIKRSPFTRAEIDALEAFGRLNRFRGLAFDPLVGVDALAVDPARMADRARAGFELMLGRRTEGLGIADPEAAMDALVAAFRARVDGDRALATAALARAAEGSRDPGETVAVFEESVTRQVQESREEEEGFLETRRDFHTLLQTDDAERTRWVEAYPFDVSVSTDDSPFFFNYYRYEGILTGLSSESSSRKAAYHPEAPVGHIILLGSLAQITAAAALLILLPLRSLARREAALPTGRGRVLAYFSALGVGFMFIEIVLMQHYVLFLGHPTYAITVVLTSLLAFAGIGSLLVGRIRVLDRRRMLVLGATVVALVLLEALAALFVLPLALSLPFGLRVALAVALLAPLAVVLGMPFPLGVRILSVRMPDLVPWAWAINGFLSVFSSIFCIVLAMAIGFTNVLVIGALIYAGGFLAMSTLATLDPTAEGPTS